MSKENLEQFMSKVADSEELQAKIGEEIDAEALIALGAECGCEFTAEELQESAELSDDELDTVSGGRQGPKSKKHITRFTRKIGSANLTKNTYILFDVGPITSRHTKPVIDHLTAGDDTEW